MRNFKRDRLPQFILGLMVILLLCTISTASVSAAATTYYTTADLTLRTGPGTNYKAVGWLKKNAKISSLAKSGKWHRITFNKKNAYVSGSYLTTKAPKPITPAKPKPATAETKVLLNVPMIAQRPDLPTGCEIVSLTMVLKYKGAKVDKGKLAKEMPRHASDTNKGYVGNPYTSKGYTIYPLALMNLTKKYAGTAVNMTGASNATLEAKLRAGRPIVTWVKLGGFNVHCVVLTGYDSGNYYYNDPWTNKKNVKISKTAFNKAFSALSKRALSY
ncbi:C39 family peptidase [Listeria booriae]|uniref:C39 family peptidase n=1 Tax=Listeria booriae TaxID=1552123 RepID=UPI00162A18FB|nr:C39 family peptidase [Listeria booriae]MBC2324646.1 SH3 domain-containing protein [Listeria booriae]